MKTRIDFFYKRGKQNYQYDYILNLNIEKEETFLRDLKIWMQAFSGKGFIQFYSAITSSENLKLKRISKKYEFRIFEFNNGIVKLKNKNFKG